MSFLDDDNGQKIVSIVSIIVFFFLCTFVTYCCVSRRRSSTARKLWVVLKQPQVGFCTLVTNRDPYYRVIEEYTEKYESMDYQANEIGERETSRLLADREDKRRNAKRLQQCRNPGPDYPTTAAYPQYEERDEKNSVHSV